MKFNDYLLTLSGVRCILWISGLSSTTTTDGRFALEGLLEPHEDFLLVHADESGIATAVRYDMIICIEPLGEDEIEEEEEPEEDIHAKFERQYRHYKDQS